MKVDLSRHQTTDSSRGSRIGGRPTQPLLFLLQATFFKVNSNHPQSDPNLSGCQFPTSILDLREPQIRWGQRHFFLSPKFAFTGFSYTSRDSASNSLHDKCSAAHHMTTPEHVVPCCATSKHTSLQSRLGLR